MHLYVSPRDGHVYWLDDDALVGAPIQADHTVNLSRTYVPDINAATSEDAAHLTAIVEALGSNEQHEAKRALSGLPRFGRPAAATGDADEALRQAIGGPLATRDRA